MWQCRRRRRRWVVVVTTVGRVSIVNCGVVIIIAVTVAVATVPLLVLVVGISVLHGRKDQSWVEVCWRKTTFTPLSRRRRYRGSRLMLVATSLLTAMTS